MDRRNHLLRLLDYEGWANRRLIDATETVYPTDERIARLLAHILNAHAIWLDRIAGRPVRVEAWQIHPWPELAAREATLRTEWLDYFDDLDRPIAYRDLQGNPWTSPLSDIVQHVLNHSTYHRGQIAARLVELGHPAPPTDYIVFARNPNA